MKKLVLIGAGAHAHVIIQILKEIDEYEIVGCLDNREGYCRDIPIIGDDSRLQELYNKDVQYAFVAIGNNKVRARIIKRCKEIGYTVPVLKSTYSIIANDVSIGEGTVVMPGAIINTGTIIGDGCIINTRASIDHDNRIDNYVHIAPGVTISGSSYVGVCSFLGTGSSVIDKVRIGSNVMVGAGAVVVRDIEEACTVVGVPARRIK